MNTVQLFKLVILSALCITVSHDVFAAGRDGKDPVAAPATAALAPAAFRIVTAQRADALVRTGRITARQASDYKFLLRFMPQRRAAHGNGQVHAAAHAARTQAITDEQAFESERQAAINASLEQSRKEEAVNARDYLDYLTRQAIRASSSSSPSPTAPPQPEYKENL